MLLVDGDFARWAKELKHSALWIGGSPGGDLAIGDELLDATRRLTVATGIVNIWQNEASSPQNRARREKLGLTACVCRPTPEGEVSDRVFRQPN